MKKEKIHSLMEGGQDMEVDSSTGHSYSGPAFIGIETTTRCNLNCIMCARRCLKDSGFIFSDMTLETFRRILPLIKTSKLVFLSKCGEPLLAPNIMEMIGMCRPFGCKIAMASNASLMDEGVSEQLIDRGLDWIELSIDGIESFSRIRGFELGVFIKNVKALNEIKRKKKKPHPAVTFTFVAMKDNLSELPAVIRLAASLGVERIFVHPARIYHHSLKGQSIYHDPGNAKRLLSASKEEAARLGVNLVVRQVSFMKDEGDLISSECYCLAPFDRIFVDRKGYLNEICCGHRRLGEYCGRFNVNQTPIRDIWNCDEYRTMRLEFLSKNPAPVCKNCNFILGTHENQMNLLEVGDQTVSLMKEDGVLKVSVGVCAYNEEDAIGALLDSVARQKTRRVQVQEVIVVSDGSTDRTDQIVSEYARKDPRVVFIRLPSRRGKYAAVNEVLKNARGSVIALSSADIVLEDDALEKLCLPFLARESHVGITGARPVPVNDPGTFMGYLACLQWRVLDHIASKDPKFGELIAFRNVIEHLPETLVDEEYIAASIKKRGYTLQYVPEALIRNKGPETIRDFLIQRRRIFCGHLELKKTRRYKAATLSAAAVIKACAEAGELRAFKRLFWFSCACALEAWGRLLGYGDFIFHKNDCRWPIAKTTKKF